MLERIRQIFFTALLAGVMLAALLGSILAVAQPVSAQQAGDIVPGRYIVTFKNGVPPGLTAASMAQSHGFRILHVYQNTFSGMAIQVGPDKAVGVLQGLRGDARVSTIGNDRYSVVVAQQYTTGLDRIDGQGGTAGSANTGEDIVVAVVDTGIDTDHPDLVGRIDLARSVSCLTSGGLANNCRNLNSGGGYAFEDDHYHGTFVSGIIAANDNNIDIVGVVPDATIIAVKVCNASGLCPDADITAGVDYLADPANRPDVVNMSLGGPCGEPCETTDDPTHTAIRVLVGLGTTFVVAAGNSAADATFFSPAGLDAVVTASAMTETDGLPGGLGFSWIFAGSGKYDDDTFAKFSNYGDPIDVIAPGVQETSLLFGGGTAVSSGTSFSSPFAAGVAAVFIQHYMDNNDGAKPSPDTVRQALIQTGECHEGAGSVTHDGVGCSEIWPNDKDSVGEPMVRADNVVNFSPPTPAHDVAVTAVSADPSSVEEGFVSTISVTVTNTGDFDGEVVSISVAESPNGHDLGGSQLTAALASGGSETLDFSWTGALPLGDHTMTATATLQTATDGNPSNDTDSTTVTIFVPVVGTTHDVAVAGVSAPGKVKPGKTANVSVTLDNLGTVDETVDVVLTTTGGTITDSPMTGVVLLAGSTGNQVTFKWGTTGATEGTHTLTATVTLLDNVDEDTSNNSGSTTSNVGNGGGNGGECKPNSNKPACR